MQPNMLAEDVNALRLQSCGSKMSTPVHFNLSHHLSRSALGFATLSKFGRAVECREARQARAVVTSELLACFTFDFRRAISSRRADCCGGPAPAAGAVQSPVHDHHLARLQQSKIASPRPSFSTAPVVKDLPLFTANGEYSCKANMRMQ